MEKIQIDGKDGIYLGEWNGDVPHGQGVFVDMEGDSYYQGQFKEGLPHGYGRHVEEDTVYEGQFD